MKKIALATAGLLIILNIIALALFLIKNKPNTEPLAEASFRLWTNGSPQPTLAAKPLHISRLPQINNQASNTLTANKEIAEASLPPLDKGKSSDDYVGTEGSKHSQTSEVKQPEESIELETVGSEVSPNSLLSKERGGKPKTEFEPTGEHEQETKETRASELTVNPVEIPENPPLPLAAGGPDEEITAEQAQPYEHPVHSYITSDLFWIGEKPNNNNALVSHRKSAWDSKWKKHFGGTDNPDKRCGYEPCKFVPKQNPFYVALPYNDLNEDGTRKESAKLIPWYYEAKDGVSIVKNRWLSLNYQGKTCYAQWEQVGPFQTDDFDYVFGTSRPVNKYGIRAGIDVSPAVRDCLGIKSRAPITWQFVEFENIPPGPWWTTITKS